MYLVNSSRRWFLDICGSWTDLRVDLYVFSTLPLLAVPRLILSIASLEIDLTAAWVFSARPSLWAGLRYNALAACLYGMCYAIFLDQHLGSSSCFSPAWRSWPHVLCLCQSISTCSLLRMLLVSLCHSFLTCPFWPFLEMPIHVCIPCHVKLFLSETNWCQFDWIPDIWNCF